MRRRQQAWVLGVAAVVLATAGCTGSSAGPTPTSSASSPPTGSKSPAGIAAPKIPTVAQGRDAAGAQAFARYWFDVINYTMATTNPDLLRSISLEECRFCADFASRIEQARTENKSFKGGQFTPTVVVAPLPSPDGTVVVDSRANISPGQTLSGEGKVLETSPGGSDYAVTIRLKHDNKSWMVSGVAKE